MEIDWGAGVPAHIQIAAAIRAQIESGALRPGDRLPHRDELAATWDVSRQTISNAMRVLREQGMIVYRPGRGIFVAWRT